MDDDDEVTGEGKVTRRTPTANQDLARELIGQSMGALSNTATVAQNNFVTVSKLTDYDYLEGHRVIGLTEAVGVREVSSRSTPGGPVKADE